MKRPESESADRITFFNYVVVNIKYNAKLPIVKRHSKKKGKKSALLLRPRTEELQKTDTGLQCKSSSFQPEMNRKPLLTRVRSFLNGFINRFGTGFPGAVPPF